MSGTTARAGDSGRRTDGMSTLATGGDASEHDRLRCGGAPPLAEAEPRVELRAAGLRDEDLDEASGAALLRRPDQRHFT